MDHEKLTQTASELAGGLIARQSEKIINAIKLDDLPEFSFGIRFKIERVQDSMRVTAEISHAVRVKDRDESGFELDNPDQPKLL